MTAPPRRELLQKLREEIGQAFFGSATDELDTVMPIIERELAAARKEERERCARVADKKAQDYLSPKYATGQPLSSFAERFACGEIAAAIRALED